MSDDRQNVVLVTVDSLRADHCGFMGYENDVTPTLDAMADEGVVFENAVAPGPATPESMPKVFTGQYFSTGADEHADRQERIRSHMEQYRTIPEWFSRNGYTTLGYTPNPFTSRHFGFDRGFDHFEDFLDPDGFSLRSAVVSRWANDDFVAGLRLAINMLGFGDISMTWEDYYADLVEQVERASEPFFLWVFLLEPHWPYQPPKRYREVSTTGMVRHNWRRAPASNGEPSASAVEDLRSLYDGTIRHVDEFLARISDDLAPYDPAVVFHSDHGESFGDHGNFGHGPHAYEENLHVPLVVWGTGHSDRVHEPVSLARIPAILRGLTTESAPRPQTNAWVKMDGSGIVGVRGRSSKLVRTGSGDAFYDLETDPTESASIDLTDRPDIGDRIQSHAESAELERRTIAAAAGDMVPTDDI